MKCLVSAYLDGSRIMYKDYRISKIPFSQFRSEMCWSMMKPGALFSRKPTSAGSGQLCAVEPDNFWRSPLAIAAKLPVACCGAKFLSPIGTALPIQIFGKPIRKFCLKRPIVQLAKKVVKRLIWSVGTALYVSGRLDLFARPFRFQNVKPFITWLPSGTLLNITWL